MLKGRNAKERVLVLTDHLGREEIKGEADKL